MQGILGQALLKGKHGTDEHQGGQQRGAHEAFWGLKPLQARQRFGAQQADANPRSRVIDDIKLQQGILLFTISSRAGSTLHRMYGCTNTRHVPLAAPCCEFLHQWSCDDSLVQQSTVILLFAGRGLALTASFCWNNNNKLYWQQDSIGMPFSTCIINVLIVIIITCIGSC